MSKYTQQDFIKLSNSVHNNQYDYSCVDYQNVMTNVKIICKIHGVFWKNKNKHVDRKQGCPDCGRLNGGKIRLDVCKKSFEAKANNIHDFLNMIILVLSTQAI